MNDRLKTALWIAAGIIVVVVILTFFVLPKKQAPTGPRQKTVAVHAFDGRKLEADLFLPRVKEGERTLPGVLLIAPYLETRKMYTAFARNLAEAGMAVLSMDVRDARHSMKEKTFEPNSVAKLPDDVRAGLAYLIRHAEVDSNRLAVFGTGISARAGLVAVGGRKSVRAAVLVSAVLDSTGLAVVRNNPGMPILVISSFQDAPASTQIKEIFNSCPNPARKMEVYINAGVGSQIWWSYALPEMTTLIRDWLSKQLLKTTS